MAEADSTTKAGEDESGPERLGIRPSAKRSGLRIMLLLVVPIALLAGAGIYWLGLQGKVSTDNAYVKQYKFSVTAEVGGKVIEVFVAEGDTVETGQLLFRIDPEPYRIQIAEAQAAIAEAQANVIALSNSPEFAGVDIAASREEIAFAQAKFDRVAALRGRGFSTKADYDAAEYSLAIAKEHLRQAQARQREASAKLATGPAVPGVNPQVAAAMAQRANAELALRRTEVRAPIAGRVAQADRLQAGQQVIPNLPLVTLVANESAYVEANFKETDLTHMRPGQRAKIRVDAYPDIELRGHVASIGAGTDSEFSILPAQNATGNWVKVTQRVPVRITIDEQSSRSLISGLSSYVTVYTEAEKQN